MQYDPDIAFLPTAYVRGRTYEKNCSLQYQFALIPELDRLYRSESVRIIRII